MFERKALALSVPHDFDFSKENKDNFVDLFKKWGKVDIPYKGYVTDGVTGAYSDFEEEFPLHQTVVLRGEYPFHRDRGIRVIESYEELTPNMKLIVSFPFAGDGNVHKDWDAILLTCEEHGIPMFVDQAFFGLHDRPFELTEQMYYVAYSFSKMFGTGFCRTGVCFKKSDVVTKMNLTNEYGYLNLHSLNLHVALMSKYEYNYTAKLRERQQAICEKHNLIPSDTVIFGVGTDPEYKRDRIYNRVCITKELISRH